MGVRVYVYGNTCSAFENCYTYVNCCNPQLFSKMHCVQRNTVCNNATHFNFKLASETKTLVGSDIIISDDVHVQNYSANERITMTFIVELAP